MTRRRKYFGNRLPINGLTRFGNLGDLYGIARLGEFLSQGSLSRSLFGHLILIQSLEGISIALAIHSFDLFVFEFLCVES